MRRALTLALAALAIAATAATAADYTHDDASARLVQRLEDAIGAPHFATWKGMRWTFEVTRGDTVRTSRRHAWDRAANRHRVEYTDRAGKRFVIVHTLGDSAGRAWVDGQALAGDTVRTLVARGELLWRHDTYWFLMPFKLRDPGVQLVHQGRQADGRDRVQLTFAGGGDTYAFDLDPATGRIAYWQFHHEGDTHLETGTWEDWVRVDGAWFATHHLREDGRTRIWTKDIVRDDALPAALFEAP